MTKWINESKLEERVRKLLGTVAKNPLATHTALTSTLFCCQTHTVEVLQVAGHWIPKYAPPHSEHTSINV